MVVGGPDSALGFLLTRTLSKGRDQGKVEKRNERQEKPQMRDEEASPIHRSNLSRDLRYRQRSQPLVKMKIPIHCAKTKRSDIKRKKSIGVHTFLMVNEVCNFERKNRARDGGIS